MSTDKLKKEAKNLLQLLPDFVREHGADELKLSDCQELVARMHGFPDWHAASLRSAAPAADAPTTDEDDIQVTQHDGKTIGRLPGTHYVVESQGVDDKTRDSLVRHLRDLQAFARRKRRAHEEGIPALKRLFEVAQGNSGQCRYVAAFLLGLYNGARFPFDMTELRGVDTAIAEDCLRTLRLEPAVVDDCLNVLRMDTTLEREVHTYFSDGGRKFERLAQRWRIADVGRLKSVCEQIHERGVSSFGSESALVAEIAHALANTWPESDDGG